MDSSSLSDHIRQYLMLVNEQQSDPIILKGLLNDWSASSWKPDNLHSVLFNECLTFRVGKKKSDELQWENSCKYVDATVEHFNDWIAGKCQPDNPFELYDHETHWAYADYKYMSQLFAARPHVLQSVDWSKFGFPGRDGTQSTFWLGSPGAYTVCHYDTYGCNLVGQIYGRKRWILVSPTQTECMYPTRIPYEESSVFSLVNMQSPDLNKFPKFQQTTPVVVTLEPGDVLLVPRHWWHFVENLETSISINTWIELEADSHERVKEAIARTLTFSLMSEDTGVDIDSWLNPTEDLSDHEQNMKYIRTAIRDRIESEKRKNSVAITTVAIKRDQNGAEISCEVCKQFIQSLSQRPFCRAIFDSSHPHCSTTASDSERWTCSESSFRDVEVDSCASYVEQMSTADLVRVLLNPVVLDVIGSQLEKRFLSLTVSRDI